MALQPHQVRVAAIQIVPRMALAQFAASMGGNITRIFLKTDIVNNNGNTVFDVRVNGATLFPVVANRPKILSGQTNVAVVGSFAIAEGDDIAIDLISVPAGGIGGSLKLIVTIDDGISSGGGSYTPTEAPLPVSAFITMAYGGPDGAKGVFARVPTSGEMAADTATLTSACEAATFLAQAQSYFTTLFGSAEYVARARTNAQYVGDLYAAMLGRLSDATGQAFYEAQLTAGRTRAEVRADFANSVEFINRAALYCRSVSLSASGVLNRRVTLHLVDDFVGGAQDISGSVGELGWSMLGSGGITTQAGELGHPGITRLDNAASDGISRQIMLSRGISSAGMIHPSDYFDLSFLIRVNTNDNATLVRAGLQLSSTNGIYLEKLAADVSWFGVCRAANVQTRSAAVAATSAAWAMLRVRRANATTIAFSVNGGAEQNVTTNIPAQTISPSFYLYGAANANKTADIDLFEMYVYNLPRG